MDVITIVIAILIIIALVGTVKVSVRLLVIAAPFLMLAALVDPDSSDAPHTPVPYYVTWDAHHSQIASIESMCESESRIVAHDLLRKYKNALSDESRQEHSYALERLDLLYPNLEIVDQIRDRKAFSALPRRRFDRNVSTVIQREKKRFIADCVQENKL